MILTKAYHRFAETIIDDEAVLMNIDTGQFHALKNTGLAIWQLIDGVRSTDEIGAELRTHYTVDAAICAAEVSRFATQLIEAGFVDAG